MRAQINQTTIELILGDITQQDVDAIVNAANNTLLGGGGVDGAIHQAAGPQLVAETRTLGGCETGDAKISKGYRLKARHVIHTVGPVYRRSDPQIPALLASAYRRSLEVARDNGIGSIAFPAISTGIFGYPVDEAANIAIKVVCDFCEGNTQIKLVRFVLFGQGPFGTYENALRATASERASLRILP